MKKNIRVEIPSSLVVDKVIKGKEGDFTIKGVLIGDKFIRLVYAKDTELPSDTLIGNLFPRTYKGKTGVEYQEVAIFVENTTPKLPF